MILAAAVITPVSGKLNGFSSVSLVVNEKLPLLAPMAAAAFPQWGW